jgi:hypothetical protein
LEIDEHFEPGSRPGLGGIRDRACRGRRASESDCAVRKCGAVLPPGIALEHLILPAGTGCDRRGQERQRSEGENDQSGETIDPNQLSRIEPGPKESDATAQKQPP